MRFLLILIVLTTSIATVSFSAVAQSVEVDDSGSAVQDAPSTGKGKAREYFQNRKSESGGQQAAAASSSGSNGATPRYLALHIGTFFTAQDYRWGTTNQSNDGKLNAGVTYRLGEWVNSMDFAIRIEYTSYELDNGSAKKLSFSPIVTFPDANSRFPLYFGGGLGAGLFIQQVPEKSPVALDWQVFGGVRFLDVIEHIGFMVEAGLKNHVLLLSEGQFNGVFINVGTVFAF